MQDQNNPPAGFKAIDSHGICRKTNIPHSATEANNGIYGEEILLNAAVRFSRSVR